MGATGGSTKGAIVPGYSCEEPCSSPCVSSAPGLDDTGAKVGEAGGGGLSVAGVGAAMGVSGAGGRGSATGEGDGTVGREMEDGIGGSAGMSGIGKRTSSWLDGGVGGGVGA
jgi:hypothetical protein